MGFYFPVAGQPSETITYLKPWEVKGYAKNAERIGDTYSAIEYYERLHEIKPGKTKLVYKLAELHRESRDYSKAKDYYLEAYKADPGGYIMALYYYALMLKMQGEYTQAKQFFEQFTKENKGNKDDKEWKKISANEIEGCELAKVLMDSAQKVLIYHLDTSINKAHVEFAPMPIDESTLLYASYRSSHIQYYDPLDSNYIPKARQFYVAKKVNETWKGGKKYEGPFNVEGVNTGNGVFSQDGERFYFTRCEKNWQNKMICSIYLSRKENGQWQEPEMLPETVNNPKYTSTHPALGVESKKMQEVLYFVSDRPEGKGGMDIYYTLYDTRKKEYREAKNIGSKVNTPGDELTPYFDMETRKLFFSSTGWPGIGGLDIFSTTGELTKWSAPKNIGYPINSSVDDIYYVPGIDREIGFLVSNRPGGITLKSETCCDDLYSYKWTEFIKIDISGLVYELVKKVDAGETSENEIIPDSIAMNDSDTSASSTNVAVNEDIQTLLDTGNLQRVLLPETTVSLYLVEGDENEDFFIKSFSSKAVERYSLILEQGNKYKLVAEKDGYFSDHAFVSTVDIFKSTSLTQDFNLRLIPKKAIVLDNIYYEYNKDELTQDARNTIDTTLLILLVENPKIIIELSSHTDAMGTDEYNEDLSQRRAESVVKYLTAKGIDINRIIPKGYGETLFIAPNTKPDGSDDPIGRARNRRTEFKVIGSSDLNSKLNSGELEIKNRGTNTAPK